MFVNKSSNLFISYFTRKSSFQIQLNVLFSTIKFPTNDAIQMSYKKHEFLTIDNKNKSPIVIMHGLFGSKTNWNSMSKAMVKQLKRNIITVDARNHGESTHTNEHSYQHLVADINRLYEDFRLSSAYILGHSMGGRAMMLFALYYPEKVEKLIIVDISPFSSSKKMYGMKGYFDALKSVSLSKDLSMPIARKEADNQLSQRIQDPDVRQFLLTNLVQKDDGSYGWRMNLETLSTSFDLEIMGFPIDYSVVCTKPTLFVAGSKSDYINPQDEEQIKVLFPNAEFIYLQCGHWVQAEKPYEFLSVVSNFINK